jgi:hypothetical protein
MNKTRETRVSKTRKSFRRATSPHQYSEPTQIIDIFEAAARNFYCSRIYRIKLFRLIKARHTIGVLRIVLAYEKYILYAGKH